MLTVDHNNSTWVHVYGSGELKQKKRNGLSVNHIYEQINERADKCEQFYRWRHHVYQITILTDSLKRIK